MIVSVYIVVGIDHCPRCGFSGEIRITGEDRHGLKIAVCPRCETILKCDQIRLPVEGK